MRAGYIHNDKCSEMMITDKMKIPERRIAERRQADKDRRQMIRFELDKSPRRSGKDRRISDLWSGRENF